MFNHVLIIFTVSLLVALKIIYDTRGICFFGGHIRTDNEKMIVLASKLRFWDWPSKMHSFPSGRGQLREYWVLALLILRKILKDKSSDHLNVILAISTNFMSSLLLYFVISNYFSPEVGFIVALLYVVSFWPYHVALYMGHIHLSQMFFLLAICLLQLSGSPGFLYKLVLFFLAGIFCSVSFASSSASRKYPPLVMIALLYALQNYLILPWQAGSAFINHINWFGLSAFVSSGLILWLATLQSKKIFSDLLRKIIKKDWPDDKYLKVVSDFSSGIFRLVLFSGLFCLLFVKEAGFYTYTLVFGFGILLIVCHLLFPLEKLLKNVMRYYVFLDISSWATHFNCYKDQVGTFGKKLQMPFRGEGLPWIPRLFWRVIPIVLILYIIAFFIVGGYYVLNIQQGNIGLLKAFGDFLCLVGISLLPIIVVEVTKGLQVGKSYLPSLIGFLFLIGFSLQLTLDFVMANGMVHYFWWSSATIILCQFVLSVVVYYGDILPARMAPFRLRETLRKLGVREFYTYDNPYNDSLVKTMLYSFPNEFDVHYIKSIAEVKKGIIVIPQTSSKSVSMESTQYAIEHGDFTYDEALNNLLANRKIEKLALAKIKTMGCSKIYVLESEVTSYRDLILKQVKDYDRWLGNAWVLQASLLPPAKERRA